MSSTPPILVLDTVIDDIRSDLLEHAPERGGALLGPAALSTAVSTFLYDADAITSPVTFQPSLELNARVRDVERAGSLQYRGPGHTHPGELDHPSQPDCREAAEALRLNPHIPAILLPIFNARAERPLQDHQHAIGAGKGSWFLATRLRDGRVQVVDVPVRVVPTGAMLRAASEVLGCSTVPTPTDVVVDGVAMLGSTFDDTAGRSWEVLLGWSPLTPPIVLIDGTPVDVPWDLELPSADRLATGLAAAASPPAPASSTTVDPGSPTPAASPIDVLATLARRGRRRLAPGALGRRTDDAWLARIETVLDTRRNAESTVLLAGCGSVGTELAVKLTRSAVANWVLWDFDRVSVENLTRGDNVRRDVGDLKVDALERRLRAISRSVAVTGRPLDVDAVHEQQLREDLQGVDLVLAATDDPEAQLLLDRLAWSAGIPSLFVGLTAGAKGGEVLIVRPGDTVCYGCALAVRQSQPPDVRRTKDYGSGQLKAEPALGCDIAVPTMAAARLALSLLAKPGTELSQFAERAIVDGTTFLTLGMTPDYWCFPQLLGEVPGQYAYQSVWMSPTSREGCPRCGHEPVLDSDVPVPDPAELRHIARASQPT